MGVGGRWEDGLGVSGRSWVGFGGFVLIPTLIVRVPVIRVRAGFLYDA